MSEDEKKTVYDFWLSPSISRPTGNKKDIKRVRLGPHIYSSHMIHVLNKTQTEAFLEFQTTYPDIKIKQRKFENLKPYFVRAARQQDRSTCCCRYHIEARSIFKKCMEFRKNVLTNHDVADTIQIKSCERPTGRRRWFCKTTGRYCCSSIKVTIKTAEDMYRFSIQNLTKPNESASCKRRILRLLDNTERDELRKFKPVPDNRSIQRVHCVENGIISVKKLSCYSCDSCINGNYSHCQNCHITGTERKITMTREDELNRENDFEDEDETEIKDLVNRGCIIAVVVDDPNDDDFLLKASGKAQVLSVDTTDKWGAHFLKGSEIIRGLYFNKLTVEDGMVKFKLLQRKTALVPAVSTRFICMELNISNEGILTMPEDTNLAIIDSL
ncbi:unnamed protein product [Mytilus edulis]|uniref:Uncharacterized protein n=1 Tax=Mytilus edulis TaxID=6550 RepID=A0A8S3SHA2_MYTED|nr:unnamed protein product [Mytilus edulis]